METFFYNLAGGINQAATKTNLGLDTKQIYWADSENIEILQNKGIIRQQGNSKLTQVPDDEKIIALHEMKWAKSHRLLIVTESGKLYAYNPLLSTLVLLSETLSGTATPHFVNFLNGVLISSVNDKLIFIKNNATYDVVDCNLKDDNDEYIKTDVIAIYKGRVWAAKDSVIYFSALGTYNDFITADDAGYISNFYTDTDDIIALSPYRDYLAIYKKNKVFLLTGSSPEDFAITPFADKGIMAQRGVVNVNNKQYFLSEGIYALEETGQLNQIQIGEEISLKIKPEFNLFDRSRISEAITLHYERKNQVWYFIPYSDEDHLHVVWINDYVNKAWFKRVIPQNIVTACVFEDYIVTASDTGEIFREDYGNSFDGTPIKFMWKSPFLAIGAPHTRKTIDEFYFLLDESYDNNFNFSVYKDYDSENRDDTEKIDAVSLDSLVWDSSNALIIQHTKWNEASDETLWATATDSIYKAEISEANYAIQLCVEGETSKHSAAIIGLEFKEIYEE